MWIQDSVSLAAKLHPIFEQLEILYYITKGVAAIAYGEPRTTQDLDLVLANLTQRHRPPCQSAL